MSKVYERPVVRCEEFVATEYVAACYYGDCDVSGRVISDSNGNGQYDFWWDEYAFYNNMCGAPHEVTGENIALSKPNGFIFTGDSLSPIPGWIFRYEGLRHFSTNLKLHERPNHS